MLPSSNLATDQTLLIHCSASSHYSILCLQIPGYSAKNSCKKSSGSRRRLNAARPCCMHCRAETIRYPSGLR